MIVPVKQRDNVAKMDEREREEREREREREREKVSERGEGRTSAKELPRDLATPTHAGINKAHIHSTWPP